jgi:hypothetical protein
MTPEFWLSLARIGNIFLARSLLYGSLAPNMHRTISRQNLKTLALVRPRPALVPLNRYKLVRDHVEDQSVDQFNRHALSILGNALHGLVDDF